MKRCKFAGGVLIGIIIGANARVTAAPEVQPNAGKITEITFRQACLCAPSDEVEITLTNDDPWLTAHLNTVSRWIETQHFFELKDHYIHEASPSHCARTYSITRDGKKKNIKSDCAAEPPELWAFGTIMTRIADEIKVRLREERESKQGVLGTLQNYASPDINPAQPNAPLIIRFLPEPCYQPSIESNGTIMGADGKFRVNLFPGTYRLVLEYPDLVKVPRQLITIEAAKFTSVLVNAQRPVQDITK